MVFVSCGLRYHLAGQLLCLLLQGRLVSWFYEVIRYLLKCINRLLFLHETFHFVIVDSHLSLWTCTCQLAFQRLSLSKCISFAWSNLWFLFAQVEYLFFCFILYLQIFDTTWSIRNIREWFLRCWDSIQISELLINQLY